MTSQYAWNEQCALDEIGMLESVIPVNLEEGNFSLATQNYGRKADRYAELGLLHWRHGLDPRPDFENGVEAYETMRALAVEHAIPKNVAEIPAVYAMLSLMGRQSPIAFEDEAYHEEHRWPCYECCLVHALHDQPLNERHEVLLGRYLETHQELVDRTFLNYFQLLGLRPSDRSIDELARYASENWTKRMRDQGYSDRPTRDGYGVMNELYVDLYLAAVLAKIHWRGESLHRWKWPHA